MSSIRKDDNYDCVKEPSAKALYLDFCKCGTITCKPNSTFLTTLSDLPGNYDLTEIDLSKNYAGPQGFIPILKLAQQCKRLQKFIASHNFITNDDIFELVNVLSKHPSIAYVDLSDNAITSTSGMALLEMLMTNPRIKILNVSNTSLGEDVIQAINRRLQYNQSQLEVVKVPSFTERLKVIKKIFQQICQKESSKDKIRKKNIIIGHKLSLQLVGKEIRMEPAQAFEYAQQLQEKCVPDKDGKISWEAFLIVSMCSDVKASPSDIARLKAAFEHWDKNHNDVIEIHELKDMMAHINGQQPTTEEVMEKMMQFGVTGERNQYIDWDMFILMLYEWLQGVPSAGGFTRRASTTLMLPSKTPRRG
jgi:RNA-binding protein YhbY